MSPRADALGVEVRVGDTVTVTAWGAPVRLSDVGRRSEVTGATAQGRLVLLDGDIAGGRAVPVSCVLVARRDGQPGHEGNRARVDATVVGHCSACGASEADAPQHVAYVRAHGKCVL
jgi:hypothetical protein